ncbi:MAG TPA: DUF302 domain-containing protein [Alphaproteobacteria bacterium]|jgi:uncharacterized protein (DUF302 family)
MLKRLAALIVAVAFVAPAFAADPGNVVMRKTKAKFEDVKEDVVSAVTKRGLVVDYTGYIGAMLDRTAKDVGATKKVYAQAEAIQFCPATLARKMMEADPHNIAFCPYVIAIYSLAADPGTVYVAYRRPAMTGSPQSRAALKAVDDLLSAILKEAVK